MTEPTKIEATEVELEIMGRRALELHVAAEGYAAAKKASADVNAMFARGHDLPPGTEIIGIQGRHVLVQLPPPKPATPEGGTTKP